MGCHTIVDVFPFVAHNIAYHSGYMREYLEKAKDLFKKSTTNEMFLFEVNTKDHEELVGVSSKNKNGWSIISNNPCGSKHLFEGNKKRIKINVGLKKDDFTVFLINEADLSAGEEVDIAVVSSNEDAIKMFLKDFGITDYTIEKDDVCKETM